MTEKRKRRVRDRTRLAGWLAAAITSAVVAYIPSVTAEPTYGADGRIVHDCPQGRPRSSGSSFESALRKAAATLHTVEFLDDDAPCAHAREVTDALTRKLGKNYFAAARSHSFALIRSDGGFFSVELYAFGNRNAAAKADEALGRQADRSLSRESVTAYQWQRVRDDVVLFIADVHVRDANRKLFETIASGLRVAEADLHE